MDERQLSVDCAAADDGWQCSVTVDSDPRATKHEVTVSRADLARFAPGADEPTDLVEQSFRFMLEREPRESILRRFELPTIGRYFPEYETEIGRRLDAAR